MPGYFESVDEKGVTGWVDDAGLYPPNLTVLVDGKVPVSIERQFFRFVNGRHAFQMPLRLEDGARVEILDHNNAPLAGGTRFKLKRRTRLPSIAIVAAVKAEAPYLIEWIAYHRVLGIKQFYLADNGGDDGTSSLVQRLDAAGIVVRLDWLGAKFFQLDYYARIVPCLIGVVDIVAIIDADEFLTPLDGRSSVPHAAAELFSPRNVVSVGVNWAVYGSSSHKKATDKLVIERFSNRADRDFEGNRHIKTLLRPEYFAAPNPNPHFFNRVGGRYTDTLGVSFRWNDPSQLGIADRVSWNALRLNHYVVKSLEEYETKMLRGKADNPNASYDMGHFAAHDRNEIHDPQAIEIIERTKKEMEELKRLMSRPSSFFRSLGFRARSIGKRLRTAHFD